MREWKVGFLFLGAVILLAGCASRLGYPAKTVGIPTPVTLFSKVATKGTLTVNMDYMARDIWSSLYGKKFQELLDKMSREKLKRQLDIAFSRDAGKAADLFTLSSSEVMTIDVDYAKSKTDPQAYSGFDLSQYKDSIPTQYVLALVIDEWGLLATKLDKENGPYIKLTIQLIDKDTNMSAWSYTYLFQQQVDKDANELTTVPHLEDIFDRLIPRSVDQYFNWLGW